MHIFHPQGRIKHIHENMPKNAIEPSPKFDCHLSKIANRVTSLLSYRAFELTQVNISLFFFFLRIFSCVSLTFCCVTAILFRVRIRWDQGTPSPRVPLRCGVLSVQRQGGGRISFNSTQVKDPVGNGTFSIRSLRHAWHIKMSFLS